MNPLDKIYFNSHDLACRSPFGAVRPETTVRFSIDTGDLSDVTCYLNYYVESPGEKDIRTSLLVKDGRHHRGELTVQAVGLCFYWFSVSISGQTTFFGNSHDALGGLAVPYDQEYSLRPFQITVHQYDRPAPAWYKNAVFYQIFPDRFCNGNEDGKIDHPKPGSFLYANWHDSPYYVKNSKGEIERWEFSGGNLLGIRSKLDYLQSIGVSGIYLNPVFEARSNHRYDTGDYHKIDPMLGTNEDFTHLMEECARRGIGVILDGVFNHTGADSKYFNARRTYDTLGASQSPDSPYHEWYSFKNFPDSYECWWGVPDLPNVDETKTSYQDFILNPKDGVISYWTRRGALGWRLDVADELPDFFIQGIRSAMDAEDPNGDLVLIGEVWEDASNKIAYSQRRRYLLGDELHGVMNYPFKDAVVRFLTRQIRAEDIYRILMSIKENYPSEAFYANFNLLGTHDTRRIRTELKDASLLRLAVNLLMTLPGVPCIYYGDEAGLCGERDPYNRAAYPWGREDLGILAIYQAAVALRKSSPAFTEGDFHPFFAGDLFGFIRHRDGESHLMVFNPSDSPADALVELPNRNKRTHLQVPAMDFVHMTWED